MVLTFLILNLHADRMSYNSDGLDREMFEVVVISVLSDARKCCRRHVCYQIEDRSSDLRLYKLLNWLEMSGEDDGDSNLKGEIMLFMSLVFSLTSRRADRQTDRQTDRQFPIGKPRRAFGIYHPGFYTTLSQIFPFY
jgi:hypothetical protein